MGLIQQRVVWDEAPANKGALMTAIADARRRYPSGALGVGGSWCSPKTLFESTLTEPLQAFIREQLPPLLYLDGWAFLMEVGDKVTTHGHEKSHRQKGLYNDWAGVYYVTAPTGSGMLVPDDEPDAAQPPQEGELVLFRADMQHHVTQHAAAQPRWSIAFNAVEQRGESATAIA